jgi:hypothetical protein
LCSRTRRRSSARAAPSPGSRGGSTRGRVSDRRLLLEIGTCLVPAGGRRTGRWRRETGFLQDFVEGERRDSNPRPPGPQPVGAAWSRAASVLGSAAIGCDQMRPRLSGEPVRASASVTTAGPSERAIAAIAARKCETPRGPESGRRVSNPRPSAWEVDARPIQGDVCSALSRAAG